MDSEHIILIRLFQYRFKIRGPAMGFFVFRSIVCLPIHCILLTGITNLIGYRITFYIVFWSCANYIALCKSKYRNIMFFHVASYGSVTSVQVWKKLAVMICRRIIFFYVYFMSTKNGLLLYPQRLWI